MTSKASVFQKTMMNSMHGRRLDLDDDISFVLEGQPMDIIGQGLVTQTERTKVMPPSINKTMKSKMNRKKIM